MKSLQNFVLGATIAAVCLTPAVSADAHRVLSGQPLRPLLASSAAASISEAAMAARVVIPYLIAGLAAEFRAESR